MVIQLSLKHSCLSSHLRQPMCLIFIYIHLKILYAFCFMAVAQSAESHDIKQKFYKHRWCSLQSPCKCMPMLGKESGIHRSLCIIQTDLLSSIPYPTPKEVLISLRWKILLKYKSSLWLAHN